MMRYIAPWFLLLLIPLIGAGCARDYSGESLSPRAAAKWRCEKRGGVQAMDTGSYSSYSVVCKDGTTWGLYVSRCPDGHTEGGDVRCDRKDYK